MTSITPFLWFDDQLQAAVDCYTSLFGDSAVISTSPAPEGVPGCEPGSLMSATFRIGGQEVMGLNGGPHFALTPAFSFFVSCEGQAEVDRYWDALLEGGEAQQCGWLTDRFGVTWQIVPTLLMQLMGDPDPAKAGRVVQAMLQMVKLDCDALQRAYDGVA